MSQRPLRHSLAGLAILLLFLSACGPAPTPSPTPAPTSAPTFASTETPAPTPLPTLTGIPASQEAGDFKRTLIIGGLQRTYSLHIPARLSSQGLIPLVFVFHGYQENSLLARAYTGFDQVADAGRFIVAYPNGTGDSYSLSWNANACCGYALETNVDDQEFIRQMIADIGTLARIDPKRIYATGFSNGALLSYRLACEMSDAFAAVAPVAGVLVTQPCQPEQPVSLLAVNGMNDTVVPYGGGTNSYGITFPPIKPGLATWAQVDGCNDVPQIENTGTVHHSVYPDCKAGIGLEFYAIDGLDHSWPAPYDTTPSITQIIWDFFAAHPKP